MQQGLTLQCIQVQDGSDSRLLQVELAVYQMYMIINKRLPGWQDPPNASAIKVSSIGMVDSKTSLPLLIAPAKGCCLHPARKLVCLIRYKVLIAAACITTVWAFHLLMCPLRRRR